MADGRVKVKIQSEIGVEEAYFKQQEQKLIKELIMLWTIIVREMQEHLKSLKFQIGFLIMIVLLTIVTNINIKDRPPLY